MASGLGTVERAPFLPPPPGESMLYPSPPPMPAPPPNVTLVEEVAADGGGGGGGMAGIAGRVWPSLLTTSFNALGPRVFLSNINPMSRRATSSRL